MSFALAYLKKDSVIHRLNPITLLYYAVCMTFIGFIVTQPQLLAIIFLFSVLLVAIAKVFRQFFKMYSILFGPVVLALFLIYPFLYPGAKVVLFKLGPLNVYSEGLMFATNTSLRLMGIVSAYFFLVLVTYPRNLMIALEEHKTSPKLSYLILTTLQLVPYLQQTAERILDAQRSRGLSVTGNILQRARSFIPLITPMVIGSFSSLEIKAMALEVRGFDLPTRRVYITEVPDTRLDHTIRVALVVLSVLLIGVSILLRII
jgi:energy-coupling factor transport system permease protein